MALLFILQHLNSPGTYARILFVDFLLDFLSDRKQHMKLGKHIFFPLYTDGCNSSHQPASSQSAHL